LKNRKITVHTAIRIPEPRTSSTVVSSTITRIPTDVSDHNLNSVLLGKTEWHF
jgi:hypothetical protein